MAPNPVRKINGKWYHTSTEYSDEAHDWIGQFGPFDTVEDAWSAFRKYIERKKMKLNERRAWFVYEAARLAAFAAKSPVIPEPWELRDEAFRSQFLEVIEKQCGSEHTDDPKKLHDEWVEAYVKMDGGVLQYNVVFVPLCKIAKQWVCDAS